MGVMLWISAFLSHAAHLGISSGARPAYPITTSFLFGRSPPNAAGQTRPRPRAVCRQPAEVLAQGPGPETTTASLRLSMQVPTVRATVRRTMLAAVILGALLRLSIAVPPRPRCRFDCGINSHPLWRMRCKFPPFVEDPVSIPTLCGGPGINSHPLWIAGGSGINSHRYPLWRIRYQFPPFVEDPVSIPTLCRGCMHLDRKVTIRKYHLATGTPEVLARAICCSTRLSCSL